MEGGGWCNGDSNCYQRSQTPLGSSKTYGPAVGPTEADVLFSLFPEHVAVYAKYCDGSSWTSDVSDPVQVAPGQVIHYRGRALLDSLLDDLLTRGWSG